ncbi:hypothetical protein OG792_15455 [Micromonospora sp. NBC_01699]|uniref:hypothetical protein n=1 Tax=Micromonospora sp. NBC_01699 TaxID=2975984 RepID=UPI002E2F0B17|nr:hypothetical protein [Micromonospora sp. NBC_01699]
MDRSLAVTERGALAHLCTHLPAYRDLAEAGSWSEDLDWWIGKVRDGGSAVDACRELGLLDGEADTDGAVSRGPDTPSSTGGRLVGLSDVVLTGQYRCPSGRCARRGQRDDRGRTPVCELSGVTMSFHADA